jgi:DNA repair exonuclease SbcCD ATPase subunit
MRSRAFKLSGRCRVAALCLVCAFSNVGHAQQADAKQSANAQKLAELRTEVDDLDASIRSQRHRISVELSGLDTRLAEIKIEEDAARLRVRAIETELAELKSKRTEASEQKEALFRSVEAAIKRLETAVRSGLPYKTDERLAALSQIRDELSTGQVGPEEAAVRVWRFVEDEQRLASTIERSEIRLSAKELGPPRLVQAVRLGMVAMYTYSADGTWGSVLRNEKGFSFSVIKDKERIREIKRLFASVEKQVLEGHYSLPFGHTGAASR